MKAAYLLGFRGAGKSTLGRLLATELKARFLDLDELFEKEKGQSTVAWITAHGAEAFRAEEARLLREVEEELSAGAAPTIVALGGGIVEGEASRTILAASPAARILLEVPAEELWARLQPNPARRQVGNLNTLKDLQDLLARRRPHFENISTNRVENCDINEALAELKRVLGARWR